VFSLRAEAARTVVEDAGLSEAVRRVLRPAKMSKRETSLERSRPPRAAFEPRPLARKNPLLCSDSRSRKLLARETDGCKRDLTVNEDSAKALAHNYGRMYRARLIVPYFISPCNNAGY